MILWTLISGCCVGENNHPTIGWRERGNLGWAIQESLFARLSPKTLCAKTNIMSDKFTPILAKKIDLYLNPSMTDLGLKTGRLTSPLKPDDLPKTPQIISDFISIVGKSINSQSQEITKIIKTTIKDAMVPVDGALIKSITELCESRININKYLNRFANFIDAIDRHYSRMGLKFDKERYRLDLPSSKYEAMVKTLVRRNNEKIKTELEILLHAADTVKNNIVSKSKDRKMISNVLPTSNIWKVIETDYDISKRVFGKKISFVADKFKRKIIFRDIEQAYMLAQYGCSKPAVILAGSVIEELLRLYLVHKGTKPKRKTFDSYIKACEDNDLLKTGINKLSDSVRHFRNIVHLQKEATSKTSITKVTAKGAVTSIFTIANDF